MQVRIDGPLRTFLLGLLALIISAFAASAAGIYLGSIRDILEFIPGVMLLLPASINMRGSVGGVLASRLSSSMHLGAFDTDFSRSGLLGGNVRASFIVTVITACAIGIFAALFSGLLGIQGLDVSEFITISVVSGILSGMIVLAITLLVAILCYRYGLDLDMIAAPSVTTAGDVVTLPILVGTALVIAGLDPALLQALFILVLAATGICLISPVFLGSEMREISRQIIPLLVALTLIGTLAGVTYTLDLDRLVEYAVFLILIPPFMGACGSIAGILCSRLATGMHMGAISPGFIPETEVIPHFVTTYLYALIIIPLLAIIAEISSGLMGLASPGLPKMLMISISAGLIVITIVTIISYLTASTSFRYGLDPDNFGIPVITSVIDLVGAAILIAVINILL